MSSEETSAESTPTNTLPVWFHRALSGIALVGFVAVIIETVFGRPVAGKPGLADSFMLFGATAATISALSRHLPLQNVLLSAAIISVVGGVVHGIGATTAIPFGPFIYTDAAGPRIGDFLVWPIPLLWVVVILNSRGVARLILRPWRKMRTYGFWLLGITAALAVLADAALEPFASVVKHYWLWQRTRIPFTWGGAPISNFFGWLLTALLILAFATPALIDKRVRPKQRIPDFHPLIMWLLGVVLCGIGAATRQLWFATGYCAVLAVVTSVFAIRGGRW